MPTKKYKTVNGLMSHLRNHHLISISGSLGKRRLINHGYFHGYKGYRNAKNIMLPFSNFEEIHQTILFDSKLKVLFYEKLMFIETAIKSIVTQSILDATRSDLLETMFNDAIENYRNIGPNATTKQRRQAQERYLQVRNTITTNISREYKKDNPIIVHYYEVSNNTNSVPVWALIEILMLGDFGALVSSLKYDVRNAISNHLGISISYDTNRDCFAKFVYVLKDLRNAIAHNGVVYDARFLKSSIKNNMKQCLIQEFGLPFVQFKDITDYVILIVFFLKKLKVSKTEQKIFINKVIELIDQFIAKVGLPIAGPSFHNGWKQRLVLVKQHL